MAPGSATAVAILKLVNTASLEELDDQERVGLNIKAAEGIVAYRKGPDGVVGSLDDNRIDNLNELSEIAFVGLNALEALFKYVKDNGLVPDASLLNVVTPPDPDVPGSRYQMGIALDGLGRLVVPAERMRVTEQHWPHRLEDLLLAHQRVVALRSAHGSATASLLPGRIAYNASEKLGHSGTTP